MPVPNDFYGLPTLSIANEHLQLDVLAEAGPRIVRVWLAGVDENQLAETPTEGWETPYGWYHLRGGHRLWHSPEEFPRTYVPDNTGLMVETTEQGLRLRQPTEAPTGLQKTIELALHPDRPAVTVRHTLVNNGVEPVEIAPWAITQLPLGGVAVLPQHAPARTRNEPNRQLNLWPYSEWHDPRLRLDNQYLLLDGSPRMPQLKVGYRNHTGWVGYLRNNILFCKRFEPQPAARYPDQNSNVEVFCHDQFLELETLGPLRVLEPGQEATHIEHWDWYRSDLTEPTIEQIGILAHQHGLATD